VIQSHPQSLTILAGQSAPFSVSATGTDIVFQWNRNGVPIPGATLGSYTLAGATAADSGAVFTVTVRNSVGILNSDPATLTVHVCDPMTHVPTPTSCGVGACARTGLSTCVAGAIVNTCVAGSPAPSDASCNGVDEDCSGTADEDYVPMVTTCAMGACAATGMTSCLGGVVQDSCTGAVPAPNDTSCDGRDDDCDGRTDEDYVVVATTCGIGACASSGMTSCAGGAIDDSCVPGIPAADDATCDGIDDDCDGVADGDYDPVVTTCGTGACTATGMTSCVGGLRPMRLATASTTTAAAPPTRTTRLWGRAAA
jgi:hypothetical protein